MLTGEARNTFTRIPEKIYTIINPEHSINIWDKKNRTRANKCENKQLKDVYKEMRAEAFEKINLLKIIIAACKEKDIKLIM